MSQNKSKRFLVLLSGLLLAFGWLTFLLTFAATAQAAPSEEPNGAPNTAPSLSIRYVHALTGSDISNDCTSSAAPCRTLQNAANMAAPGDEIRVAEGTYDILFSLPSPPDYPGPGIVDQVLYIEKNLTIRGGFSLTDWNTPDLDVNVVTLDAGGKGRGIFIFGGVTVHLEGLHIWNGNATELEGNDYNVDAGGGVYALTSTVTIDSCQIVSNTASITTTGYGGGIYMRGSTGSIINSGISLNVASTAAGGIGGGIHLINSPLEIANNNIYANKASTADNATADGRGGGLHLHASDAYVHHNTIDSNIGTLASDTQGRTGWGGGINVQFSTADIGQNLIIANLASTSNWGRGGGLHILRSDNSQIYQNRFNANTGATNDWGIGGGIYIDFSDIYLANNAFYENHSGAFTGSSGSAIAVFDSSPRFDYTTVVGNTGGDGSAIFLDDHTGVRCDVDMYNTLLADNETGIFVDIWNQVYMEGNLWHNNNVANVAGLGTITTASDVYGDPLLDVDRYHLLVNSAAIDNGVVLGVTNDIDGDSRNQGGAPDIGADEFLQNPVVDLVLTKTDMDPVTVGDTLRYTLTVKNQGTLTATNVLLEDTLPASVVIMGYTASRGSCGGVGPVICDLGWLDPLETATVTLDVVPNVVMEIYNTAQVGASEIENNLSNNTDDEFTTIEDIVIPTPDLALTKDGSASIMLDTPMTYTLVIKNEGTALATGVILTDTLPGSMIYLDSNASIGICTGTGPVICSPGDMVPSDVVTFTITVLPTLIESVINHAEVTANEAEITLANNTAVAHTDVINALLYEKFTNGIPATWSVIDGGNYTGTWTTLNPCGRGIDPPFLDPWAMVDSDCQGTGFVQDEVLLSPALDASSCATVTLSFDNQFQIYSGVEFADVDITTVSGVTVTNVLRMMGVNDGFPTPNIKVIDISPYAAGKPDLQIAFHYYNATYDYWWAIDNVRVDCEVGTTPSTPTFALKRHTFGNGGGKLSGSSLSMRGVIGQPSALGQIQGTSLTIRGGFLHAPAAGIQPPTPTPTPTPTPVVSVALNRHTFGNGGGQLSGTTLKMKAAIGQPSALGQIQGTSLILRGGFWHSPVPGVQLPPAGPDIQVSISGSTNPISLGDTVTYTFVITNAGPGIANGVVSTNTLPADASILSYQNNYGICSTQTTAHTYLSCDLSNIAENGSISVTLVVSPTQPGWLIHDVETAYQLRDPDPANNSDSVTIGVAKGKLPLDGGGKFVIVDQDGNIVSVNAPPGTSTTPGRHMTYQDGYWTQPGEADIQYSQVYVLNSINADRNTPPTGYAVTGHTFSIDVFENGAMISPITFQKPVTITVSYMDDYVRSVDENTLTLFYWDGNNWIEEIDICSPSVAYTRKLDENQLSFTICRTGEYGIFGDAKYNIFIPLIMRNDP